MIPRLFLRMSRWARHPPSEGRVILVLAVIAVCVALAVLNRTGWWPEALTLPGRGGLPKVHAAP